MEKKYRKDGAAAFISARRQRSTVDCGSSGDRTAESDAAPARVSGSLSLSLSVRECVCVCELAEPTDGGGRDGSAAWHSGRSSSFLAVLPFLVAVKKKQEQTHTRTHTKTAPSELNETRKNNETGTKSPVRWCLVVGQPNLT